MYPTTGDAAIARVAAQIESLGREIGLLRKETAGDMRRIEAALARVEEQTESTSERVTALEKVREHDQGEKQGHEAATMATLRKLHAWLAVIAVSLTAVGILVGIVLAVVTD